MRRLSDTEAISSRPGRGMGELTPGERFEGANVSSNPNAGAAQTASTGLRPNVSKTPNAGCESLRGAASYLRGGIR